MATRFYFNVTKAADLALSRPLNGFWEVNASVLQTTRRLTTTRYGGAVIGPTVTVGNGTNPNDQLWFQGISDPLAAQTISGTLTGVMVVRESNTSANLTTKVRIYVVNKSGTVVATLYDGSGQSTEWNSPSANTRGFWDFGSASISSYTCSGGDRIVVEIGCRVASTRTADTAYMYLGDQSTTSDLPTGDASSNNQTLSPWIQFSGNLTFGYTETKTFTADSVLKGTQSSSFTLDAVIDAGTSEETGSFTADAIVKGTASGSFSADAVVQKSASATFNLDAVLKASASGSFPLDSIVQRATSTTFTVDAHLRTVALVSFTADAILQREQQSSATVDAIVRKGATGSFSAGALLLSPRTGSFTLDAVIKGTRSVTLTLDSVLLRTATSSFSVDAVRRSTEGGTFDLDAWLIARRQGSFTLDAVFANVITGSFTLDAVLGLAVLPDIDAEVVIRMIEAETAIHQIDFASTIRMIEAETSFTGG